MTKRTTKTLSAIDQEIEAARAAVRACEFGTPQHDAAWETMRKLTQQAVASAPREEYRSIDGDIFDYEPKWKAA